MSQIKPITRITIRPLISDRWSDLEQLFGAKGAVGGCWCMWWRLAPKDFSQNTGQNNQIAFQKMVSEGRPVGLLAYAHGQPIGWCSVAPREQMIRIRTATTWRPIDGQSVWSIVCYFVHPEYRGQHIATRLLKAAVKYARAQGAKVIEAYPKDLKNLPTPAKDESLYFGTTDMYLALGFVEVARRHVSFPIMRLKVGKNQQDGFTPVL